MRSFSTPEQKTCKITTPFKQTASLFLVYGARSCRDHSKVEGVTIALSNTGSPRQSIPLPLVVRVILERRFRVDRLEWHPCYLFKYLPDCLR